MSRSFFDAPKFFRSILEEFPIHKAVCDNNLGSIDAINVFLRSGTKLRDDNFDLILYRITNDSDYTDDLELAEFIAMDPLVLTSMEF
jgi:hypothetical protein